MGQHQLSPDNLLKTLNAVANENTEQQDFETLIIVQNMGLIVYDGQGWRLTRYGRLNIENSDFKFKMADVAMPVEARRGSHSAA